MFRLKGLIVAMVMVCFVFMAFNSNPVMADDAVELDILKKVKKTKRIADRLENILESQVLPRLGSVPKTGQSTCYDESGVEIPCAATGHDGDLQKGTPWPNPRFTDNGDGTVTDNMTGLIWLKNANCFGERTWVQALNDSSTVGDGICGLSDGSSPGDWRLPNVKEHLSLSDYGNRAPAILSDHPFTNLEWQNYWSATTYFGPFTDTAWLVDHGSGGAHVDPKTEYTHGYVWCVRNAQ